MTARMENGIIGYGKKEKGGVCMTEIQYPAAVGEVLSRLTASGEEAYLVGGSLRDALLGLAAHDFDVATSARPEKTMAVFSDCRVIETGIRHGTVTVILSGVPIEITTFRRDGEYTDGRHPDSVCFTDRITEDLSRRDFTVNAMAYHPDRGLVDPFGGKLDLQARTLRAVREPHLRFDEDSLRILRAFRFAAQLGFSIEPATLAAAADCREGLARIARERVASEFFRLCCSKDAARAIGLMQDAGVLRYVTGDFLPDARSLAALASMPDEDTARLGVFFFGASAEKITKILQDLRCSARQIRGTLAVARGAKMRIESNRDATALRAEVGDYAAVAARASVLLGISQAGAEELVSRNDAPTSISDLAVGGKDLMACGLQGAEIGRMLSYLLGVVMTDPAYNNKEALLALCEARIRESQGEGKNNGSKS